MTEQVVTIAYQSRLQDYEPTAIENWLRWLELWDNSPAEIRLGLLHVGFDVSLWDPDESTSEFDRVRFYLEVADGHDAAGSFQNPDDGFHVMWSGSRVAASQVRQELARKAFDVLCRKLFKLPDDRHQDDLHRYFRHLLERMPRLLEALAWFWRADGYLTFGGPYNFPREGHNAKVQADFARELMKFVFARYQDRDEESDDLVVSAHPKFVHLLPRLDLIDLLLRWEYRPDDTTRAALRELALNHSRGIDQNPKTLEEAFAQGSQVAKTLLLLDVLEREEARQAELKAAEREAREAEARLRALNAPNCPSCGTKMTPNCGDYVCGRCGDSVGCS